MRTSIAGIRMARVHIPGDEEARKYVVLVQRRAMAARQHIASFHWAERMCKVIMQECRFAIMVRPDYWEAYRFRAEEGQ